MHDAIEFRGSAHRDAEMLAAYAGVPVYNGLTDDWHPTQMLADFLTMHESSHRPYDAITYKYMGDAHSNVGRSLLVVGAIMGSDVRICAPRDLWPPADVQELRHEKRARGDARGLRVSSQHRVRAGREPPRHDQSDPRGHDRVVAKLGDHAKRVMTGHQPGK